MSKLFDQLKDAARSRGEKSSPGLLVEAMERARASHGAPKPGPAEDADNPTAAPSLAPSSLAPDVRPRGSFAGIALAIAIFAVVFFAWHAAPWRAPAKVKIDASELKLDRSLDVTRTGGEARSSPPGPAPSK